MSWRTSALCRSHPDIDFIVPRSSEERKQANQVCAECAVQDPCFKYSLTIASSQDVRTAVWAGSTFEQRRQARWA